jgi:hypothetical protein
MSSVIAAGAPVPVTVWSMSGCPCSAQFAYDFNVSIWSDPELRAVINFSSPFSAKAKKDNSTWCFHGKKECAFERWLLCAQDQGFQQGFDWELCVDGVCNHDWKELNPCSTQYSMPENTPLAQSCASTHGLNWTKLEACATSSMGNDLLLRDARQPWLYGFHGLPVVEVNGTILSTFFECSVPMSKVLGAICAAVDAPTKPAACAQVPVAVARVEEETPPKTAAYAEEMRVWLESEPMDISQSWSQLPDGFGLAPLTPADRSRLQALPRAFTTRRTGSSDLPESFDARTRWPGCIGPVLDQGTCGSCWAVSAVSAMSDRLCIEKRDVAGDLNATFQQLSMLQVVACDKGPFEPGGNKGCEGGQPYAAMDYAEKKGGLVPESCFPYLKSEGGPIDTCADEPCLKFQKTPSCPRSLLHPSPKCADGSGTWKSEATVLSKGSYVVQLSDRMATDIMRYGPITASMGVCASPLSRLEPPLSSTAPFPANPLRRPVLIYCPSCRPTAQTRTF